MLIFIWRTSGQNSGTKLSLYPTCLVTSLYLIYRKLPSYIATLYVDNLYAQMQFKVKSPSTSNFTKTKHKRNKTKTKCTTIKVSQISLTAILSVNFPGHTRTNLATQQYSTNLYLKPKEASTFDFMLHCGTAFSSALYGHQGDWVAGQIVHSFHH